MSSVSQLREKYGELEKYVTECFEDGDAAKTAEEIRLFTVGAMLRVWGRNNMLYSDVYAEALEAVSGEPYTRVQILTAMSCCAEQGRRLDVPDFLVSLLWADRREQTRKCGRAVELLNEVLVAAAFVNGDFTLEEADAVAEIIDSLSGYCRENEADVESDTDSLLGMVTEPKQDSYTEYKLKEKPQDKLKDKPAEKSGGADDNDGITIPITLTLTFDTSGLDSAEDDDSGAIVSSSPKPAAAGKPPAREDDRTLEELLDELDGLIGLETVKRDVHSLINFIKVAKLRRERGMKVPTISYHLVFTGNPGTGKTTVARLVAQLYYRMGILSQGQLVEADRSSLVAGYLGQTALKTQKVIQQAIGGVLFIDEAYSLAEEAGDSYGREAIETILKAMEDHRDELVVIVAGYDELMHKFIESNPGLASRFSKYFNFPDYNGEELLRIFERFCKSNGYVIDETSAEKLRESFDGMYASRTEHFGNARAIRNIFEKAINCQADRLAESLDITDRDLELIAQEDIEAAMGIEPSRPDKIGF